MSTILTAKDYELLAAAYAQYALSEYRKESASHGFTEESVAEDLNLLEGYYRIALQQLQRKSMLSEG